MPRLALPHLAFLWPVPRLRLAVAVLILAAAIGGAAILHSIHNSSPCPPGSICFPNVFAPDWRPPWADPAALALLVIGVAAAARVLVTRRPRNS